MGGRVAADILDDLQYYGIGDALCLTWFTASTKMESESGIRTDEISYGEIHWLRSHSGFEWWHRVRNCSESACASVRVRPNQPEKV